MDREPLNSPLEVGLRTLMILSSAFPDNFDLGTLVFLDHALLHTGDIGGPPSINPNIPNTASELGIKRKALEDGLQVMLRAGLVEMRANATSGLVFSASERGPGFVKLLESPHAKGLTDRAQWVVREFGSLDEGQLRVQMRRAFGQWSEEFDHGQ